MLEPGSAASDVPRSSSPDLELEERAFLNRVVFYGFLIRAILAVALDWTGYSERLAPDEETYATNGWLMSLYWTGELLVKPGRFTTDQPLGYFYLNAVSFYLFGRTDLPLKLTNCFVGAVSARFVYWLARGLFGKEVAHRTTLLYTFLPSLILWSSLNIRDVWVVSLILYVSWKSLQVLRGYSHLALLKMMGGTVLLSFFRDYLFFVVALPPAVAFLIGRRGHLMRNFLVAVGTGLAIVLLVQHGAVGQAATTRMSLEAISKIRQDMATGGSAFHEEVDVSTPAKALAFLPVGIAYFLFSPFPWQITTPLKALSVPEMLLIYGLVPAMIRGVRHIVGIHLRESLQILLLTCLLTISYSLGEGNVGTLYRHRAQAVAFYLMFAAVGLEVSRSRLTRRAAA